MMRKRYGCLIALSVVLAGSAPFATASKSQLDRQPTAVGTGGAAATVDRDATRTAIEILRRGGNAVDAAVAANATLGVTEPYVAGLGGGGFMVIYLAKQHRVVTIDGRETAPQAFREDAFIDPQTGQPIPFYPQRVTSGMAVGVPGNLATWAKATRHYGTMRLSGLLQPAIAIARSGFVVDQTYHDQTEMNRPRFQAFTSSRALYLTPDGQAPAVGSVVRNPQLADAYRLIARKGAHAFYRGPIGEAVVQTVDHPPVASDSQLGFSVRPGVMASRDLSRYEAPLRGPTHVNYRGYDVYSMAPPSSGGSTVGEGLNILEGFDVSSPDRALALHRYLEATRLSFADRFGNVVSYTTTIEQIAGSAIAVPGYGFLLNNELTDFDPAPPSPGAPDPNLPAGGKRPRSSMAPTIVLHEGVPFLAVGSPGGATIITTVLQILLNRLDFGMTLPDALAAPRASQRNASTTQAEPGFIGQYGSELTARFGQHFSSTSEIGAAAGVELLPGEGFEAVAEPVRRGGGDAEVVCPAGSGSGQSTSVRRSRAKTKPVRCP